MKKIQTEVPCGHQSFNSFKIPELALVSLTLMDIINSDLSWKVTDNEGSQFKQLKDSSWKDCTLEQHNLQNSVPL